MNTISKFGEWTPVPNPNFHVDIPDEDSNKIASTEDQQDHSDDWLNSLEKITAEDWDWYFSLLASDQTTNPDSSETWVTQSDVLDRPAKRVKTDEQFPSTMSVSYDNGSSFTRQLDSTLGNLFQNVTAPPPVSLPQTNEVKHHSGFNRGYSFYHQHPYTSIPNQWAFIDLTREAAVVSQKKSRNQAHGLVGEVKMRIATLLWSASNEMIEIERQYHEICQKFMEGTCPPKPEGMAQELMPYQWRGFRWMEALYKQGIGGCLADEMGMGKTIQAAALIQSIENEKRAKGSKPRILIACPANLIPNWEKELKTNLPGLKNEIAVYAKNQTAAKGAICLISHQQLRLKRDKLGSQTKFPFDHEWDLVLFDEFHNFLGSPKSHATVRQLRNMARGPGHGFIGLSGTPMPNNLIELYHLNDLLNPGIYPPLADFKRSYLKYAREQLKDLLVRVEKSDGKIPESYSYQELEENVQQLIEMLVKPFMLRRIKNGEEFKTQSKIMQEKGSSVKSLPPLEPEQKVFYPFSEVQKQLIVNMTQSISEVPVEEGALSLFNEQRSKNYEEEDQLTVRDYICLQQVADHPSILRHSIKLMDYVTSRQPIFAETIKKFDVNNIEPGKLQTITELVQKILSQNPNDKILIFTNYEQMGHLVCDALKTNVNFPSVKKIEFLYGKTKKAERKNIIHRFKKPLGPPVLVAGRKLGSVGWNCPEANHVVIVDPWWNPNDDDQCIGRSHRIGQAKPVHIYRLHHPGFIVDDKIAKLCLEKKSWCDLILFGETQNLTQRIREIVQKH